MLARQMRRGLSRRLAGLLLAGALAGDVAHGAVVRLAVAANFAPVVAALADPYRAETGHELRTTAGATGKLAAQIEQGAPFDVFLAADAERPRQLEERGVAVRGSRFTYAWGRLVLWSAQPGQKLGPQTLRAGRFAHLAIADPVAAPYGLAAIDVMTRLGLYAALSPKLVRGESIGQTYAFVRSGAADLGFVAQSQLLDGVQGSRWLVPGAMHRPIEQQAVLLRESADANAAGAFLDFLRGAQARAIIRRFGYELP